MTTNDKREHLLKVCQTCGHWSPRYKGFCEVLQQGTGKFWRCLKWRAAGDGEKYQSDSCPQAAAGRG